ncbi:phosphoribosylformylglycinamidine cyclo-ligase [Paenibacillus sp. 2TAB19]|uniref:phosphoribosylformylglycinamidine cyclo-ligase n=1 Tax=Paenibacillus sp. 2TAB19 TaxID=3233003 RepID=UPI003F98018C
MKKKFTYKDAGVNIDQADVAKTEMADIMSLSQEDRRVINKPGAFASLFEADFKGIQHPILVLKAEEPGSKQQLAFKYGKVAGICFDLINHLVNDIVVMGAKPEAVLDTILCGKIEKDTVVELVKHLAQACREQDCTLIGGETSEQPGVLPEGQYMLNASVLGVVDRDKVIDGSRIQIGDSVLAITSNGVHTNGYSLIRKLIDDKPDVLDLTIEGSSFLDVIMEPHKCYYQPLKGLISRSVNDVEIHGMAHITGGGIAGNLNRILPGGTSARIDLSRIEVLPVFRTIQAEGQVPMEDMLRTFNMGVGLTLVADSASIPHIKAHIKSFDCHSYEIGEIVSGSEQVQFINQIKLG